MNDKQKINELLKTHGEDSNRIATLLIENAQLREAIKVERESCAEIAENYRLRLSWSDLLEATFENAAANIAEQIRARNEKAV